MTHDILVPVDGSAFSEQSLPAALDLARRAHARLHLVQVHETEILADAAMAEEFLEALANRCRERAGVQIRTAVLDGPVAATIAQYASDLAIGMIVMTTHGRSGISRAWVGSVADAVVRATSVPVLLLRPRADEPASQPPALHHILIALDGSTLSEAVLEPALALGALTGARYTLLRVVMPGSFVVAPQMPPVFAPTDVRQARADADVYLETIAARIRATGAEIAVEASLHTVPALGILDFADTHAVDVIAMATHGRAGWSRVTFGSVADSVTRGAHVPVLLYRPGTSDDDDAASDSAETFTLGALWTS